MKPFAALIPFIFLLWLSGSTPALARPLPSGPQEEAFLKARDRVLRLHEEISTLNLLNGLNLSREQMTQILNLARQAQVLRRQVTSGSREVTGSLQEAESAFTALKAEIMKGAARGEIPARAQKINARLKELREKNLDQVTAGYEALTRKLTQVLTPEQLQVVETFKPCLIPPLDLRDPVRAGQAAPQGLVKRLRQLREMPENAWQARREMIARNAVEKFHKHPRLSEEEKAAEAARLLALMEKARRLPAVEFEMEKERLAEEIHPKERLKVQRAEARARFQEENSWKKSRLSRFLLGDAVVSVLEQRLGH